MAANRTDSLVFIYDVTADRYIRMDRMVFRAILITHILRNATKLTGQCPTLQMDNDLKYTAKATQEFLKANK